MWLILLLFLQDTPVQFDSPVTLSPVKQETALSPTKIKDAGVKDPKTQEQVIVRSPAVTVQRKLHHSRKALLLTMEMCSGCQKFDKNDLKYLKSKGWRVKSSQNPVNFEIEIVKDIDNPTYWDQMMTKYGVTYCPSLVIVEDGQQPVILESNPGRVVTAQDLIRAYNPSTTAEAVVPVEASPTPIAEVNRVLALLPKPEVGFVDFGCGDGRWLIAAAEKWPDVRVTGVEIDPSRAYATIERIKNEGLSDRITVIIGDATTVKVQADVATMYLYSDTLAKMQPQLERMKAFASYMHQPPGFATVKNGDSFLYFRSAPIQQVQKSAIWDGQYYSGPVCSDPNCRMCNSIRYQLSQ